MHGIGGGGVARPRQGHDAEIAAFAQFDVNAQRAMLRVLDVHPVAAAVALKPLELPSDEQLLKDAQTLKAKNLEPVNK